MNISEIVSKELRKKYYLNESAERIMNETDEEKRYDHIVNYLDEMVNKGYNDDMIQSELQEQIGDWFKNLFGSSVTSDGKVSGTDVASKSGWGLWSQFKEYIIAKFLGWIGFQGPLAESFATALSEMSIPDLIAVFRGRQSCKRHGATVADALTEAMVTYILQSTKGNSYAYNFIKNTLFEYVKQSNFGEAASNFLCNAAYNAKQSLSKEGGTAFKLG